MSVHASACIFQAARRITVRLRKLPENAPASATRRIIGVSTLLRCVLAMWLLSSICGIGCWGANREDGAMSHKAAQDLQLTKQRLREFFLPRIRTRIVESKEKWRGLVNRYSGTPTSRGIGSDIANLVERGIEPPIYISANMPGGDEHNARLLAENAKRIHYM